MAHLNKVEIRARKVERGLGQERIAPLTDTTTLPAMAGRGGGGGPAPTLRPHDLAPVLQALETGDPLNRLMVSGIEGQVGVRIGLESDDRMLANLSLVSFPLPGAIPGAVGVLGPLRMDYALALAVVDRVGTRIADLLSA